MIDNEDFSFRGKSKPNGYSIAEILLVFVIIASVGTGVWAMHVMIGEKVDIRKAADEIIAIQQAAQAYSNASGSDASYINVTSMTDDLAPYLGKSNLSGGINTFGFPVSVHATNSGRDLQVFYKGFLNRDSCERTLSHFGKTTDYSNTLVIIPKGKSTPGIVGGWSLTGGSGCTIESTSQDTLLFILID